MDKRKILLSIFILMISSVIVPQGHSVPTGQGQQLFFDNFSTSQLSPNWNSMIPGGSGITGNLSQTGGWLTMTLQRTSIVPLGIVIDSIMANNIAPIISSSTSKQFIYSVWRIIPFNLTQIGNNPNANSAQRDADMTFGLFSNITSGEGIGIQLSEVDRTSDNLATISSSQREVAALFIDHPQPHGVGTTTNCFYTTTMFITPYPCSNNFKAIVYTNTNAIIDLNTPHIFTLEMNLAKDQSSWVSMQIDQNAIYNITQSSCFCIEGTGEIYGNLFPYIFNAYSVNNVGLNGGYVNPNQSVATNVNYVLIDNYVPSTLPQGSNPPLNTSNNPFNIPQTNNPISNPFGGIQPANIWQYFANVIGQGVPEGGGNFLMSKFYFGGSVLFAITVIVILMSLLFTPIGRVTSPFILSFILFIDTIANFVLGTLPSWIFAGVLIFFMAVMVGTIPSTIGGHGKSGV
ncbi:MAG TPA: hypothetical protein VEP90_30310 [Methylomirabilota bacterium]|nr:hypothetical protein [Methylomirabilota bacterium]